MQLQCSKVGAHRHEGADVSETESTDGPTVFLMQKWDLAGEARKKTGSGGDWGREGCTPHPGAWVPSRPVSAGGGGRQPVPSARGDPVGG